MGSQFSSIKNKITTGTEKQGDSHHNPHSHPCPHCQLGIWKFIGTEGKQYRHYCSVCKKEALFDNIYGLFLDK